MHFSGTFWFSGLHAFNTIRLIWMTEEGGSRGLRRLRCTHISGWGGKATPSSAVMEALLEDISLSLNSRRLGCSVVLEPPERGGLVRSTTGLHCRLFSPPQAVWTNASSFAGIQFGRDLSNKLAIVIERQYGVGEDLCVHRRA